MASWALHVDHTTALGARQSFLDHRWLSSHTKDDARQEAHETLSYDRGPGKPQERRSRVRQGARAKPRRLTRIGGRRFQHLDRG